MYLQRHHSSTDSDNGKQIPPTDNTTETLTVSRLNDIDNHITNTTATTNVNESLNTNSNDPDCFTNIDLNS